MAATKRKRAPNFSPREENRLFSIALKFKNIIENKETNALAIGAKNKTWDQIASEFNATSDDLNHRTTDQLKRMYENRKQTFKKKKADHRMNIIKTGGGPPPKDETENLIMALVDPLSFEGNTNYFDSDRLTLGTPSSNKLEYILVNRQDNLENDTYNLEDENYGPENFILGDRSFSLEVEDFEPDENQLGSKSFMQDVPEEIAKIHWKKYSTNDLRQPLNPRLLRAQANEENQTIQGNSDISASTSNKNLPNDATTPTKKSTKTARSTSLSDFLRNIGTAARNEPLINQPSTSKQFVVQKSTNFETNTSNKDKKNKTTVESPLEPFIGTPQSSKHPVVNISLQSATNPSNEDSVNVVNTPPVLPRGQGKQRAQGRGQAKVPGGSSRRRPTETVVRSLASSSLATKYDELADKKNVIADHAIKKIERERLYAEKEHQARMEILQLEAELKRKQLEQYRHLEK